MASLVCCVCGIIITKGIKTSSGYNSYGYCSECEVVAYKQLLSDLEVSGMLTAENHKRIEKKIKEIEGGGIIGQTNK